MTFSTIISISTVFGQETGRCKPFTGLVEIETIGCPTNRTSSSTAARKPFVRLPLKTPLEKCTCWSF